MQVVPQHPSWFAEHGIRKAHGWAWPDRGYAVVRNDLGEKETKSVMAHERQHLKDKQAGTLKSEFRAEVAGFKASPTGWLKLKLRGMKSGHALTIGDVDFDIRFPVITKRW